MDEKVWPDLSDLFLCSNRHDYKGCVDQSSNIVRFKKSNLFSFKLSGS